jgi:hypothetical protein
VTVATVARERERQACVYCVVAWVEGIVVDVLFSNAKKESPKTEFHQILVSTIDCMRAIGAVDREKGAERDSRGQRIRREEGLSVAHAPAQ